MSLLKKVKARLSQKVQASKQQRQERQVQQSTLNKKIEEARWQGYSKGAVARARKEGFRQAKTKASGGGLFGTLSNAGTRANAGLNFMNQDFATAFSGKPKLQHVPKQEGESEKGVTIHVNGTTIHVGKKSPKTPQKKGTVRKKKSKSMFEMF